MLCLFLKNLGLLSKLLTAEFDQCRNYWKTVKKLKVVHWRIYSLSNLLTVEFNRCRYQTRPHCTVRQLHNGQLHSKEWLSACVLDFVFMLEDKKIYTYELQYILINIKVFKLILDNKLINSKWA